MTPWKVTCQTPLTMGFSRQKYWSGLPFPSLGDLPDPGMEPGSPTLQADSLPAAPAGKPQSGQWSLTQSSAQWRGWGLPSWVRQAPHPRDLTSHDSPPPPAKPLSDPPRPSVFILHRVTPCSSTEEFTCLAPFIQQGFILCPR